MYDIRDRDYPTWFATSATGYGLATLKILYRHPDFPDLLQTFVWQFHDVAPTYPRLVRFLDFWSAEIEGAIHRVEVAHAGLVSATEIRAARFCGHLH
jgi:uncharacterized protein Usg